MSTIDFYGIGGHKCGSTWLHERMRELGQFNLPPVKELHYFDGSNKEYLGAGNLSEPLLLKRVLNLLWLRSAIGETLYSAKCGEWSDFNWKLKWYFSNYSDNWYASLFKAGTGIKGEITPNYSVLYEEDIERMWRVAPSAKIVFLLRNPIERAWSHYRYRTRKHNEGDIIKFMNSRGQEMKSDYLKTIERFEKQFGKGKIILGFYDAISEQPLALLQEIVEFLGGDKTLVSEQESLYDTNKKSKAIEMPGNIEEYLREKYREQIEQMASRYGSYCEVWRNKCYSGGNSPQPSLCAPTIRL